MKKWAAVWLAMAACLFLAGAAQAQDKTQAKAPAANSKQNARHRQLTTRMKRISRNISNLCARTSARTKQKLWER